MFTGIVSPGRVEEAAPGLLWVRSEVFGDCRIGASVAVNGVCLTVTERRGTCCRFDLAPETLRRTTLGSLGDGDRVNVERALRLQDELGGHIVQGHVDGIGVVVASAPEAPGRRLRLELGPELARYVVERGSLALDGVSLTVARLEGTCVEVALVPHTLARTTLGERGRGDRVNVEVDVLAKYVERLAAALRAAS